MQIIGRLRIDHRRFKIPKQSYPNNSGTTQLENGKIEITKGVKQRCILPLVFYNTLFQTLF